MPSSPNTEFLFSYGTLQQEDVQLATYGRLLQGEKDTLTGYMMGSVAIADPEIIRKSGLAEHPVAVKADNEQNEISGTLFTITQNELHASDAYEVAEYKRVRSVLKSGRACWVYVLR